jgi:hypothetical protein
MLSHTLVIAAAALIGLTIVSVAMLHGWSSWLAFRNRELEQHYGVGTNGETHLVTCTHSLARIEIADLRERVRKLEDIAAGIDV